MTPDVAASIRARLKLLAQEQGVPFDEVLRRFAIERLLYRLAQSPHSNRFILKGAQLLRVWSATPFRPTMDMDLLGRLDNQPETFLGLFTNLCTQESGVHDGLLFLPDSVAAQPIKENAEYQGIRVTLTAQLNQARIPLQVDVGFNDVVWPGPLQITFPSILGLPEARLNAYTPASVFAEKLEAMVKLGEVNSRMKDFFDLRFLMQSGLLHSQAILRKAIRETFAQRRTDLPNTPPALLVTNHPAHPQKQTQWAAFLRKNRLGNHAPHSFIQVASELHAFILPLITNPEPGNPHA